MIYRASSDNTELYSQSFIVNHISFYVVSNLHGKNIADDSKISSHVMTIAILRSLIHFSHKHFFES